MKKKIGENITTFLAVIVVICAVMVIGLRILFVIRGNDNESVEPQIELSSSFGDKMYCGGEGRVDACLRYPDGHIEDDVFTFKSTSNVLIFSGEEAGTDNHSGKFTVRDKDWITESGFKFGTAVNITVTCSKIETPAVFNIIITDAIPHTVSFKYYDFDGEVKDSSAIVMEGYKVDSSKLPEQVINGYTRSWWVYEKGAVTDIEFKADEPYYLHGDIQVQERLTTGLYLVDYLNGTGNDNGEYVGDVNFGETFSLNLVTPASKYGWNFDGWYTSLDETGIKNGVIDGKYLSDDNTLYAKWTKSIKLNTIFNSSAPATVDVVYNKVADLPLPKYNNDGSFVAWCYLDENNNENKVDVNSKFTVNSSELYAKVKFPVILDYQGATEGDKEFEIIYKDSLSSENRLPLPATVESGWKIEGWYTGIGGSGDRWTEDSIYNKEIPDGQSGILWLYAKRVSTVTYYRLLGEDGSAIDNKVTEEIVYNAEFKVKDNLVASGWTFGGYYNVQGTFGTDGDTDKQVKTAANYKEEGNLNLYAKWISALPVDTTFTNNNVASTNLQVIYKGEISGLYVPEYDNEGIFVAWYLKDREVEISNGMNYTYASSDKVYAKVKFPMQFDYQGATQKAEEKDKEYFIIYNDNLLSTGIVMPRPESETENGWTFAGWNTEIGGDGEEWTRESIYNWNIPDSGSGALKLYAKRTSTMTLHRQLDENGDPTLESVPQAVTYNAALNLPTQLNAIGWQYDGYYEVNNGYFDADGNANKQVISTENYKQNGNLHLYAKWTTSLALEPYLSLCQPFNNTITVTYKGIIGDSLTDPAYANEDAEFFGWYTSLENRVPVTKYTIYELKDGVTLYAGIHFTITVDYQNATNKNGGADSYEVVYNAPVRFDGVSFVTPIKENWTFNGYYSQQYARGTQYTNDTVYLEDHNIKIYASWYNMVTLKAEINSIEDIERPYIYGQEFSLEDYSFGRVGSWSFGGWYRERHGFGTNAEQIRRISLIPADDLDESERLYNSIAANKNVLYAKWYVNSVVVDLNGGTGDIDNQFSSVVYGIPLIDQNFNIDNLLREGFEFDRWINQSGDDVDPNMAISCNQFTTMQAQWEGKFVHVELKSGTSSRQLTVKMGGNLPDGVAAPAPEYGSGLNTFIGYYYEDGSSRIYYYNNKMESNRAWLIWRENSDKSPVVLTADWRNGFVVEWRFENGKNEPIITSCEPNILVSALGDSDKPSEDPKRDSDAQYTYTFSKWCDQEGKTVDANYKIEKSSIFTAVYTKTLRHYKVEWRNYNENILETDNSVAYGTHPIYDGSTPTQTQDETYVYTFKGWSTDKNASDVLNLEIYVIVGDTTLYAIYNKEYRKYKISFSTENATILIYDKQGDRKSYTNGNSIEMPCNDSVVFGVDYTQNTPDGWSIKKVNGGSVNVTNDSCFIMPTSDIIIWAKSHHENYCMSAGTLITLADGSQKPVEQLTGEEMLLVWNIYTGTVDVAPILFIDSDLEMLYEIINLYFSDGSTVKVIYEHGFWDYDLNKWVFLRNDAAKYVGHWFNKYSDGENSKIQLIDVKITEEITSAWSPVTFGHLCYYVNGILSMPGATEGFINIFEIVPETMKVDEAKMAADIEKYGLFTYEDFADYIPEEVFHAFNGQYLKVAMGKGLLTWDDIFALIDRYDQFWNTAQ